MIEKRISIWKCCFPVSCIRQNVVLWDTSHYPYNDCEFFTEYSALKRVVQIQSKRGRMEGKRRRENFVVSNNLRNFCILSEIANCAVPVHRTYVWYVIHRRKARDPESSFLAVGPENKTRKQVAVNLRTPATGTKSRILGRSFGMLWTVVPSPYRWQKFGENVSHKIANQMITGDNCDLVFWRTCSKSFYLSKYEIKLAKNFPQLA